MARESVKVFNGALDEEGSSIVLRGVVDPKSLHLLKTPPYQREVMPIGKISEILQGLKTGKVPDIELGMRGGDYREREGAFYLQDDIYIIDGLQRVTAGIMMLQEGGELLPRIGCSVHFNTDEKWERQRFEILNVKRTKVSPNILLRNMREELELISMLYNLTTRDPSFVLNRRVCWDQRMLRDHVISALTLLKTVCLLHAHLGPGRSLDYYNLANGGQKIFDKVGKNIFRDNIKTFFDILDECWGVKAIVFKEGASYMKGMFLFCLAMVFSGHINFWRENRLVVDKDMRRKLALFPVADPTVRQLAGASGQARVMLLTMMVNHINSGKRSKRLQPRDANLIPHIPQTDVSGADNEGEGGDEEGSESGMGLAQTGS